ncbi:MAG: fibronectin type III domain-containing protein [Gammaproteobacteria bacterium]|nr:fibronectin type III domain-containing protein [Gammaproteobacteria bacterium]
MRLNIYTYTLIALILCFGINCNNNDDDPIPVVEVSFENVTINDVEPYSAKISWKANKEVNSSFSYSPTTTGYQLSEIPATSDSINFSVTLSGLSDNTKYYFKVEIEDKSNAGNNASETDDFTTPEYKGDVEVINIFVDPAKITPYNATITFDTSVDSTCTIEYGLDTSYSETPVVATTSDGLSHEVELYKLLHDSEINFRIYANANASGYNSVYTGNNFFETIDKYVGSIINVDVVTGETCWISWTTMNLDGSADLYTQTNLYISTSLPYGDPLSSSFSEINHEFGKDYCEQGVTYYFKIEAIPYDFYDLDPETSELPYCNKNVEGCYKNITYQDSFINNY